MMASGRPGLLGVRTADGMIVPVLDFQSQSESQTVFTTVTDRQRRALFEFFYRSEPAEPWLFLDGVSLDWLSPARAGEPDLEITARSDGRGNLLLQLIDSAGGRAETFALDAVALAQAQRPAAAEPGEDPAEASPAPTREPRRRLGWAALAVLVPVLAAGAILGWPSIQRLPRALGAVEAGRPARARQKGGAEARQSTGGAAPSQPTRIPAPAHGAATGEGPQPAAQPSALPAAVPPDAAPAGQSAPREEQAPSPPGAADSGETAWYEISWGDTLWRITERYYGDRELFPALADSNRLRDPDYIIAGESLVLPGQIGGRERQTPGAQNR